MPYTNKDYFLTKIKETDLNELLKDDEGTEQESYLTSAIETADEMIDSHIKSVVTTGLPLKEPGKMIKQCSYFIAMYFLHDRIQYNDIPDRIKDNYINAVDYLEKIKNGEISIEVDADTEEKTSGIFSALNENIIGRNSW